MSSFTGLTTVLLISAVGMLRVVMTGEKSGPVWVLLACATALPAMAACNAAHKGRRLGGREGLATSSMSLATGSSTPR